jgi:hypothetical protein
MLAHLVAAAIVLRGPATAEHGRALTAERRTEAFRRALARRRQNLTFTRVKGLALDVRAWDRPGPWRVRQVRFASSPGVTPVHPRPWREQFVTPGNARYSSNLSW